MKMLQTQNDLPDARRDQTQREKMYSRRAWELHTTGTSSLTRECGVFVFHFAVYRLCDMMML